ncbi:thiol-disulfide isomerase/thioredoxin [Flavobacterium arsenatis]|uniref:Thiol-disulfide isomerase/thioredoxin n=1 Tax=Flavobacterium arsenatis TaxID=1484332 RepID=A0ABU1TL97_9FLAO|nr:TlpA disulfide reductase family protein [Flavobacterium arsenatis]MDR6966745.1 thiol-disulfide isomerase/thioredoxin [Flavobacterium arsenatis]
MKKIVVVLCALALSNVGFAQKKYATFEAKIENRNSDKISIIGPKKYKKEISLNKQGFFKDTLKVADGMYQFYDGAESTMLYLKNGFDLKMKLNAKEFDETIVYEGKGAKENNFLAQNALYEEQFDFDSALASDELTFEKLLVAKKKTDMERLRKADLEPAFVALHQKSIEQNATGLQEYYKENLALKSLNDKPAPTFDYENHKGGKTKLEDLRGKFVYIDVWATWCGPCRAEIPYLKQVEKNFHNKNIEFVSISIDTRKDYEKWKNFVSEKELGGVQLFADNDWSSSFVKDLGITGIPRFILIDPKGNIVNANADRPSSPKLVEVLEGLLK